MNKKALSEQDIRSKFITPALVSAKWDLMSQILEEVYFTKGRVIVRGKVSTRGEPQKADYVQGLESLESPDVLKLTPFKELGTRVELIHAFGSRTQYTAALRDLEAQLYRAI